MTQTTLTLDPDIFMALYGLALLLTSLAASWLTRNL